MRKKIFSILLCVCMALTLLPVSALEPTTYDGWAAATADGVTLNPDTDKITIGGVTYTYKGDVSSSGLSLATPPVKAMVYKAGSGYALYTPSTTTPAMLTLHNTSIDTNGAVPLDMSAKTIIKLEGTNSLTNTKTDSGVGIRAISTSGAVQPVTIQGGSGDSLTVSAWQCTDAGALTIDGCRVTMNGSCHGIVAEENLVLKNGAQISATGGEDGSAIQSNADNLDLTVDSGSTLTVNGDADVDNNLTVGSGSTLNIPVGSVLYANSITNNGAIVNNGTITPPVGTDAAAIKTMKLTGSGVVRVLTNEPSPSIPPEWDTYTNDGTKLFLATTTLNFTKSAAEGNWNASATVNTDGYQWVGATKTLTLGNLYLTTESTDGIDVPAGTTIVLQSGTSSIIKSGSAGSYSIGIDCYGGSDPLTITGSGKLAVTAGEACGDTNNSLGIYSESAIVIKSGNITANGGKSASGSAGICSGKSSVTISGGTIQASGGVSTATDMTTGSTGIMAATNITISGGTVTAAGGTAANAKSLGVYASGGTFSISGGTLNTAGNTAAVIAKTALTLGSTQAVTAPSGSSVGASDGYQTVLSGSAPATAVTIGAKPSTGGSGSGSGAASTVTVPVTGSKGSTKVSASVSGGTATIAATDAQLQEIASGTQNGAVKIDVSGTKANTVIIPAKIASAVDNASGSTGLEVALSAGTVTLTKSALASVAGKGDMKLSVDTVDNSKLTETQKATLGVQTETAFVVDVNVYVNGTRTSTFGDGKITISVPYILKSGENAYSITVWFINDDGTIEPKTASYANGKVTFTTEHLSQYLIVDFPFTDVAESAWYYGSVAYVYDNGLFSGTSATTFSPNAATTRQMIWMVLARMDGKSPANMVEAKAWAVASGISDGSNPTGTITRQQMAAVLYRYAQFKGYDVSVGEDTNILSYGDALTISEYAIPALQWACGSNLMQGSGNNLMPFGSATRAQVATILQRFSQNTAK